MSDATIFDRHAVRLHRDRAAATVAGVAPVLQDAAERLLDRLDDTTRRFTEALDVGGRGVVAPLLRARGMQVVSCDASPRMAAAQSSLIALGATLAVTEMLPLPPSSMSSAAVASSPE